MRQPKPCLRLAATPLLHLTLAIGLGACAGLGCRKQASRPKAAPVQITIACPRNLSSSLVIIAHQKGLLAREGDRTTLLPFDSGKAAQAAMLAGGAELALVAETPLAEAILAGSKLKILAMVRQSNSDVALVARKDRGIQAPADLRGKTIGFTKGTSGHFYLDSFCLVNRIDLGGLRLVDLSPPELRKALMDGRVDAVSTWNPHVAFLTEALGSSATVFQDGLIYTEMFCLVARPEFIREHPDQVQTLLEGLCSALDFITENPAEARGLVAAFTQVAPSLMEKPFASQHLGVWLNQALVMSLENECRWFLASGAVPPRELPDVLSYFHLPGLQAVRPQAVQIIRANQGAHP